MNALREAQVDFPLGMYIPFLASRELPRLDVGTQIHSLIVGYTATQTAQYGHVFLTDAEKSAMFGHDIAKANGQFRTLAVSSHVFSDNEKLIMDGHAQAGYDYWLAHSLDPQAALLVLWHHTPYADLCTIKNPPSEEFLFKLGLLRSADVFDAMVDVTRTHRVPLREEEALEGLHHLTGTEIHPEAVDLFVSQKPRWENGIRHELDRLRRNLMNQQS